LTIADIPQRNLNYTYNTYAWEGQKQMVLFSRQIAPMGRFDIKEKFQAYS